MPHLTKSRKRKSPRAAQETLDLIDKALRHSEMKSALAQFTNENEGLISSLTFLNRICFF